MFMNGEGAQFSGGLFAMGAIYALISMFVTGPLIGERMVEKLDWAAKCERLISHEIASAEDTVAPAPRFGCDDLLGTLFGREGSEFCDYYGGAFENNPITESLEAASNVQREAQQLRRELAASRAGSRCECAVTTTLEDRRVQLAIYGGSARLVTPPSIKLLGSELEVNLSSTACAMEG